MSENTEEREKSDLTLTVAGTADKVAMIEAGASRIGTSSSLKILEEFEKENA